MQKKLVTCCNFFCELFRVNKHFLSKNIFCSDLSANTEMYRRQNFCWAILSDW